jgi:predicted ATPase
MSKIENSDSVRPRQITSKHHFVRVDFLRFKAFEKFTLHLRNFNILVGPNNAGKSTILAAFRILAAALRKANSRNPQVIKGPNGPTLGYVIDINSLAVAEENIFYNYIDDEPATVQFKISNGNELLLYFPEVGSCYLIARPKGRAVNGIARFRTEFNCSIGFVPILGPVDHNEPLYGSEAARLALFNYQAARNFRNIWHHFPERFDEFRVALNQTWPGMDIEPPMVDRTHERPLLRMFCPEGRIPREIFWSGFGFQVWCQMLTHLIQSGDRSLFLIDEPDIYLHSDLQRQLLSLLRALGPDILIATHSTEIIADAEPDDIVLINKRRPTAQRVKYPTQLDDVFRTLGSNLNPVLTQLAKTRRAVFVEGKDFQIISKFARKLGNSVVESRAGFAVIPVDGFNPERARSLKLGIELTLGGSINAALILDRDFRSDGECEALSSDCRKFCSLVEFHRCKEIENFLLVDSAIDRAAAERLSDQGRRMETSASYVPCAKEVLNAYTQSVKDYVTAQCLTSRRRFERLNSPGVSEESITERLLTEMTKIWSTDEEILRVIPGKDALSSVNRHLQTHFGINVTPTGIVDAMKAEEIPPRMKSLIEKIASFVNQA